MRNVIKIIFHIYNISGHDEIYVGMTLVSHVVTINHFQHYFKA